jgi:oligoribonuclease
MHTKNNLWQELYFASQGPQRTMAQVGDEIVMWCAHYGVYPGYGPMLGQGVAFDREILQMRLPAVRKMWNHRVIDVSGLKFLAKAWHGLQYTSKEEHRALADILQTIDCLRWLRREMFVA